MRRSIVKLFVLVILIVSGAGILMSKAEQAKVGDAASGKDCPDPLTMKIGVNAVDKPLTKENVGAGTVGALKICPKWGRPGQKSMDVYLMSIVL